jgi:hypothetical protein
MPFKVGVGPPQIAIHHGQTVLVTEPDAQIHWPSERGLFFFDTRILSSWTIYANGAPWDLLNGGATNYYTSTVYLTRHPDDPQMVERCSFVEQSRRLLHDPHQ